MQTVWMGVLLEMVLEKTTIETKSKPVLLF
jgi:hypothetical protein